MTPLTPRTLALAACFVTGLGATAIAVGSWTLPRGGGALPARVGITLSLRDGTVSAFPAGRRIMPSTVLVPGAAARTRPVRLVNVSGKVQRLRLRATPALRDLDALLAVRVRAGSRTVFGGRLAELRRWTRSPVRLAPGEDTRLVVELSLPRDGVARSQGRTGNLELELLPQAVA